MNTKEEMLQKLHECVANIMAVETEDSRIEQLQGIISIMFSLLEEGKAGHLNDVLNFHFPDYYFSSPKLFHCTN